MEQELLKQIAGKLYNKKFADNSELKITDDVMFESRLSLMILYFESDTVLDNYKRYHMVVTNSIFTEIFFYETNIVERSFMREGGVDLVIKKFRKDMYYWLISIDSEPKSVSEDTISKIKTIFK